MKSYLYSLLGAALLSMSTAQAGVVFADNFNAENASTPVLRATSLSNWTVVDGNVDIIGSASGGSLFDLYPGNGLYLDLDGSGRSGPSNTSNASIKTKASFLPGSYMLTFLLGNNPGGAANINSLTVSLGDFSTVLNTSGAQALSPITLAVNTTTGGSLSFLQGGAANYHGSIIDDLALSSVPEPASVATMLGGLVGLGVIGRLRARRRQ